MNEKSSVLISRALKEAFDACIMEQFGVKEILPRVGGSGFVKMDEATVFKTKKYHTVILKGDRTIFKWMTIWVTCASDGTKLLSYSFFMEAQ